MYYVFLILLNTCNVFNWLNDKNNEIMQTFWKNVEDMSLPFLLKYFENGPETFCELSKVISE